MTMKPTVWQRPESEADSLLCPVPGIYSEVPFEIYTQWDAVSASRLKLIDDSPLHYRLNLDRESEALRIGRYIHTAILEPNELQQRYIVGDWNEHPENVTKSGQPSDSKSTTYYKDNKAAAERNGLEIVSKSDRYLMEKLRKAISDNDRAVHYLRSPGDSELSIVWHDSRTGLRCKARIDRMSAGGMTDLKTCANPGPEFEWNIWNFKYHRQAAFYLDGWNTLSGLGICEPVSEFRIVAAGKEDPVLVCAAPISDEVIAIGFDENIIAMESVRAATEANHWPGYTNPTEWSVPSKFLPEPADQLEYAE